MNSSSLLVRDMKTKRIFVTVESSREECLIWGYPSDDDIAVGFSKNSKFGKPEHSN